MYGSKFIYTSINLILDYKHMYFKYAYITLYMITFWEPKRGLTSRGMYSQVWSGGANTHWTWLTLKEWLIQSLIQKILHKFGTLSRNGRLNFHIVREKTKNNIILYVNMTSGQKYILSCLSLSLFFSFPSIITSLLSKITCIKGYGSFTAHAVASFPARFSTAVWPFRI